MSFGVFDLGGVYSKAEAIRGARQSNELAAINLDEVRRRQQNLQRVREMRQQFDNGGEIVRQLRAAGENDAADQFIQTQMRTQMSELQLLKQLQGSVTTPAQYEELRSSLIRDGAIEEDDMPVEFDRSFFRREAGRQRQFLKQFEVATGVKRGVQQNKQLIIDQATGRVIFESDDFPDPASQRVGIQRRAEARKAARAEAPGRLKTSTSAEIRKSVSQFYREQRDALGRSVFGDADTRQKATRVTAAAERYAEQGMPVGQAVSQALADEGETGTGTEGPAGPPTNDPAGLRGLLR